MVLHLHRAPRTDLLADALGELLSTPLGDPFATELVLVPARGVERWLSQRLSHRLGTSSGGADGVCAGVEFRFPRSLVAELTGTRDEDPWAPDALAWPLLSVLDTCLDEPWAATLAAHLGHRDTGDEAEFRRGRRYAVARRLAGLFASYAAQRPQLLADWSTGRETDGLGGELDADLRWQPPLWRALAASVDAPVPAARHAATLRRLSDGPADLPERLSLFGHTRMPATEIELLRALATHHDLHLWLPHPSADLWARLGAAAGPVPRRADHSHREVRHPLLASLGRDLRELQRGLGPAAHDQAVPAGDLPDTLLGRLQSDLRADQVRPAGRRHDPADRSVQVHRCHGPARQVQVLREVLLGLLADDPTLEPRDILVMCPDIESYAPLITASFGLGDVVEGGHPAHRLRVQLADRSLTQTNPLLGVAAQLLDVAGSRATASAVLDLAQSPPVRRRFGFVDDDLDTLADWVREAGVRWGFDAAHREPFGVRYLQNTWRFGLDRVLVGVAMSDDSQAWLGTALPLDDVGSNRVELAGRFAEYVDRLVAATDRLTGTRPLADWLDGLVAGVADLTRVDGDDQWQVGQVQRELARVGVEAGERGASPLRLTDVRAMLEDHLAGRPTRANFRAGSLTVCTMVPMRSVPHRVVCLLGVDDGVFPRQRTVDGDDVLAREPVTGERDVRAEDRQLLLDAIGAATERLVVTYTGADPHSGQERPPAVPLGELLDALDRTTEAPVRADVVVKHPLQGFDLRNVEPGRLGTPTPFTFDPQMLAAARAVTGPRQDPPAFFERPLTEPAAGVEEIALADLVRFFGHPVKGFFRALDLTLPWDVDAVSDAMPVEIDQLETWGVGDRMLDDMVRGIHPDTAREIEWRRGALPPGQLGWRKATEVRETAMNLALAALTHRQVEPKAYDVDVALPGGRRLTGTLTPVYADRLVSVGYSRLDGKHLLESWVRLLALAAGHPDHNWTALTIGRAPRGSQAAQRLLGPPGDEPLKLLNGLVELYDEGRRAPLHLPLKTSFAWASAARMGQDPRPEALKKWKSSRYPGEDADAAHVRVWGEHADLDDLSELPALAERLWAPLLDSERGPL
ncbi:exodeoxyribonuclease V subunit gamma [Nocardioides anomalus]|uniref:RecBCD enzyme subunit RecC n=1 Tax=Nocardioides anomalus TaxID=2712223 RepID=A0A6G6WIM3_9ACTN|nr:exodeoxyribonuclease V subunit gamma [Nocardioides anomalus]QIG45007.1 exodeoxyribonuclease V subunit gamma [Nocardioides anomalus]